MRRDQNGAAHGFTLIELLVVVAIIALLIAILLPSLAQVREQAQASVCAGQLREMTHGCRMWVIEQHEDNLPANRGWAAGVLNEVSGQTALFTCPSDEEPFPLPAFRVAIYGGWPEQLITEQSPDGPFCKRQELTPAQRYWLGMEDLIEGFYMGGDHDYNDAAFEYTVDRPKQEVEVNGRGKSAAREFMILSYDGKVLIRRYQGSGTFRTPLLDGSYAMNASAGLLGAPYGLVALIDYHDWSADVEGYTRDRFRPAYWADDPEEMVAWRHLDRANAGFFDGHVERLNHQQLRRTSGRWFPKRPPGYIPAY